MNGTTNEGPVPLAKWDVALEALLKEEQLKKAAPLTVDDVRRLALEYAIRFDDIVVTLFELCIYGEWQYRDRQGVVGEMTPERFNDLTSNGRLKARDLIGFDGGWAPLKYPGRWARSGCAAWCPHLRRTSRFHIKNLHVAFLFALTAARHEFFSDGVGRGVRADRGAAHRPLSPGDVAGDAGGRDGGAGAGRDHAGRGAACHRCRRDAVSVRHVHRRPRPGRQRLSVCAGGPVVGQCAVEFAAAARGDDGRRRGRGAADEWHDRHHRRAADAAPRAGLPHRCQAA